MQELPSSSAIACCSSYSCSDPSELSRPLVSCEPPSASCVCREPDGPDDAACAPATSGAEPSIAASPSGGLSALPALGFVGSSALPTTAVGDSLVAELFDAGQSSAQASGAPPVSGWYTGGTSSTLSRCSQEVPSLPSSWARDEPAVPTTSARTSTAEKSPIASTRRRPPASVPRLLVTPRDFMMSPDLFSVAARTITHFSKSAGHHATISSKAAHSK